MAKSLIEAPQNCYTCDDAGQYQLIGSFTKETVPINNDIIRVAFDKTKPITLSLEAITLCDSAFLALLIEYKRDFPSIAYKNFPERVTKLLDVYGAHELIE